MGKEAKKISWDRFYEIIMNDIYDKSCKKYGRGNETHLKSYVEQKYPDAIAKEDGQILIDIGLLGIDKELDIEDFGKEYLRKTEEDYSASDIATHLFDYKGVPPIETMSPASLEKLILSLFDEDGYKSKVYNKLVQGGHSVRCVDSATAEKIRWENCVCRLIEKQTVKAEKKADCISVGWKRYVREKSEIEFMDELADRQRSGQANDISGLSLHEKTLCMLQELFSLFFTDIRFDSFSDDLAKYKALDFAEDFGKEYQELEETFSAPHFGWKYYKIKDIDDAVLDRLAEKIAAKLNQAKGKEG